MGANLQTFQALPGGPGAAGAGHRRSTSSGYYSTLSPDLLRALSPDVLRADSCAPAPERRVLLPSLRQARGFQFESDVDKKVRSALRVLVPMRSWCLLLCAALGLSCSCFHWGGQVDLLLASPEKTEREAAQGAEVGGNKLGRTRVVAHTRQTRGTGGVHRALHHGDRHLPQGSSVITQQANNEVSPLMAAVLAGGSQEQVSVRDGQARAQDLPAPDTIEVRLSRCVCLLVAHPQCPSSGVALMFSLARRLSPS